MSRPVRAGSEDALIRLIQLWLFEAFSVVDHDFRSNS